MDGERGESGSTENGMHGEREEVNTINNRDNLKMDTRIEEVNGMSRADRWRERRR